VVSPIVLLLAVALDRIVGDSPAFYRYFPHPVNLMTIYFRWAENGFNRAGLTEKQQTQFGAGILILFTVSLVALAILVEYLGGIYLPGFVVTAVVIWLASTMISMNSLLEGVQAVQMPLAHSDINAARAGFRDFNHENADECDKGELVTKTLKAGIRYFAEGVVAPIFWLAVLGLPGLVFFTAISIAAAGAHRRDDDRSAFYGFALTFHGPMLWIPAQITAALIALSALADGLKWMRAGFRGWRKSMMRETELPYLGALSGTLDLNLSLSLNRRASDSHKSESEIARTDAMLGDINNMISLLERAWTILLCLAFVIVFLDAFLFEGVFV
jgi:adenosylcobinamide-phosphate synthase